MPRSRSPDKSPSLRCTATTASGSPCKAWSVRHTDPPLCGAHGGGTRPAGAPPGNTNALKHGFYSHREGPVTIESVIEDLATKQAALSAYVDANAAELTTEELVTLLRLQGQNASRIGRLLRDQRALSGDAADGLSGAIAQALDELASEWGVPL